MCSNLTGMSHKKLPPLGSVIEMPSLPSVDTPTTKEIREELDFLQHEYNRFKLETYTKMTQFEREYERLTNKLKAYIFNTNVKETNANMSSMLSHFKKKDTIYNYTHEKYSYKKQEGGYKTVIRGKEL